eukprot:TRINITY_DN6939_c0_g1_i1.p1 TRINITY_DN6939_c0_g1~~TRINITY_DN6939_c0_g1_i1.p1  ORF type:complete len:283 (-),score=17.74 TRINITY_DN6939_c0_g1_i1:645-1493(-)
MSRMVASTGLLYGKFTDWLATYVNNMREATRQMVRNGGDARSRYWKDVSLGTVHEAFYRAFLAQNTYRNVAPTIIEVTPLRSGGCEPSNALLRRLFPGEICSRPRGRQHDQLSDGSQGCIEVAVDGEVGWINRSSVVPYGWYRFMPLPSGGLNGSVPIYKGFESEAPSDDFLRFGEAFTIVERRGNARRLGDGRGWIRLTRNLTGALRGTLGPDQAISERAREIEELMSSEPRQTSNITRSVSAVSQRYNSAASVVGRLAVKTGFFVGGRCVVDSSHDIQLK